VKGFATIVIGASLAVAAPAGAQSAQVMQAERMRQDAAAARHAAEQRYQIGQMERVL